MRTSANDLIAWKAARKLASDIYAATAGTTFAEEPGLRAELRAAATSIMTSVAAGYERKAWAGFRAALWEAVEMAGKLESLLFVGEDLQLLPTDRAEFLRSRVTEVCRLLETLHRLVSRYEVARAMDRESVN